MISLLPAEIRRQTGRRGAFFGAIGFNLLFAGGLLIWVLLSDKDIARTAIENGTGMLIFSVVLSSIVIGATAGAYDVDQGTMRYLVLTGRPRWQLVLVRLPGLFATITLVALPALLVVMLAALLAPSPAPNALHNGEMIANAGLSGTLVLDLFYGVLMSGFIYGTLSLAIGTFLKSNGVAIAVAVVLNFAGLLITGLAIEQISADVGFALLPAVASVVIDRQASVDASGASYSVAVSALMLVGWLTALIAAAVVRVQRAEY